MQAILNVALPIFGIILAGYLAGRWRILGGDRTRGRGRPRAAKNLPAGFHVARNPLPVSIALGILVSALGLPLPTPVERWLDLLGTAAAPCALFAIGLFLSDKSIRGGLAEASLATSRSWRR